MFKNKILKTSLLIVNSLLFTSIQLVVSDASNEDKASIGVRTGVVHEITLSDGQYMPSMSNNPNGYEKIIVRTSGNKKLEKRDYDNLRLSKIPKIDLSGASADIITGDAFSGAFWLTEFKFPKDLKRIEDGRVVNEGAIYAEYGAFAECTGLTNIELPSTLTYIGDNAFGACSNLTGPITFPNGVTKIGQLAFEGCTKLSGNLILPKNLKVIGTYAFYRCSKLTGNLVIPEGVVDIGYNAFQKCTGLTGDSKVPDSVTVMGANPFGGTNLNMIVLVDKSHRDRQYKKDIIKKMAIHNTYIEMSESIYKNNDWSDISQYKIGYPFLDGQMIEEGSFANVDLNLTKLLEVNNIIVTKNNQPYEINKPYDKLYSFNKPGVYNVKVNTVFNNVFNFDFEIKSLDSTPPELNITGNPSKWTNGDVHLNISVTDDESGVMGVYVPGGNFIASSNFTHTILLNGEYTFIAEDNNGNRTSKTVNVTKIDKEVPKLELNVIEENGVNYLNINSSDDESGFNKININGVDIREASYKYKINRSGVYAVIAYDNAGNCIQKEINVDIDLLSLNLSLDNIKPTNQSVGIVMSIEDPDNMFKYVITPRGEHISMKNSKYIVNLNGVYSFILVGKDNKIKLYQIEVSNIDNKKPSVDITKSPSAEWSNIDVNIQISGKDIM